MTTSIDRLTAAVDAFALDQITAGTDVDELTSALLLVENFGAGRCATLLRTCADAVEGGANGG